MPPTLPPARCALTAPFHPCRPILLRGLAGGLLSVALSLGSPPPDVIRRRVRVEPGLSSARESSGRPADWPAGLKRPGAGGQGRASGEIAAPLFDQPARAGLYVVFQPLEE